jgi:simple sugar transport system permease protein
MSTTTANGTPAVDERLVRQPWWRRAAIRPEVGAVIGAVVVFIFFATTTESFLTAAGMANVLDVSATLGIAAVGVALLMIAGEFDLSAGVMTGTSGLIVALLATEAGWNVWLAIVVAMLFGALVGLLNGMLVVRTGLPSFIITLATMFMLQGLNLGVTKAITGTVQVGGLRDAPGYTSAEYVFASTLPIGNGDFRVTITWWLAITAVATWVLLRSPLGNWIFAVGGNVAAARSLGVPSWRTKVGLFMLNSMLASLVGVMLAIRLGSVQANTGIGQELVFIVAAVIGGCLMTGGYGSAIGASIGALIFGMAQQGIVYAGWDADWFKFFLGVLLLAAVIVNLKVRERAESRRTR